MNTTGVKPLFLLDDDISYQFAIPFCALGYDMTSVHKEFPGRRSVPDDEIIDWIGCRRKVQGVWITADLEAMKLWAKVIVSSQISVLWLKEGRAEALTALQELQLIALLVKPLADIYGATTNPLYLQASMNLRRPHLERLVSHLCAPKLEWQRVPIP